MENVPNDIGIVFYVICLLLKDKSDIIALYSEPRKDERGFMFLRKQFQKVFLTSFVIWAFLLTSIPVSGQQVVPGSSLTGGSSAFVFRKVKKKSTGLPRRRKAKRSKTQRRSTRRKVVRQSRRVAKKNRVRRKIKKVTPQQFAKIDVVELQRKSPREASKIFAGLAEFRLGQDKVDEAILAYEQAVELDKTNKDAMHGLSEVYTRKGDDSLEAEEFGRAKRYYEQAILNDPKNSSAYAGRGQYYDSIEQVAEAKVDYLKALSLDPDMNQVKLPLGIIYFQEGDIAKSDELVSSALSGGTDNAETQYFLGLIRFKQGNDTAAESAFRKSIALDDSNDDAHFYLGEVLNRTGRAKDAVVEYERATKLDAKYFPAWFALGVAYYNQERWNDSIKAFQESKKYNTNSTADHKKMYAESYANIGESYRQLDNVDMAISNYRNAVNLIENDAELYTNYGFVLGRRESWDQAIENFKKAAAIAPDSISYANLGWAYYNKASYDKIYNQPRNVIEASLSEAKPALSKAVSLDSKFIAAYLNLGVVLNELGDYDEAYDILKKANKLQKDWVPVMVEFGVASLKLKKYDDAIKQLKRVVKKDNNNSWAHFFLAEAYWYKGDKKEARKIQSRLQGMPDGKKRADRLETIFRTIDAT